MPVTAQAVVEGTQVVAEDRTKPASPDDIAVTIGQFRDLTAPRSSTPGPNNEPSLSSTSLPQDGRITTSLAGHATSFSLAMNATVLADRVSLRRKPY